LTLDADHRQRIHRYLESEHLVDGDCIGLRNTRPAALNGQCMECLLFAVAWSVLDTLAIGETQRGRATDDEWNIGRTLIGLALAEISMVAQHLAVVGSDHDDPWPSGFLAPGLEVADK